jgi:hypothetical protein
MLLYCGYDHSLGPLVVDLLHHDYDFAPML